jgi:TP53 regulating kinase and related kinases
MRNDILLLHQTKKLLKRGAEADIYLRSWYGKLTISKVRNVKPYRHKSLDDQIRKSRTINEANMISASKITGVVSPFLYFVDPFYAEIIMEFVDGKVAKDVITPRLCEEIGKYTALLHSNDIIHGDLTTSNFIISKKLVILDFGLSYYSQRREDRAVDIRLIKEIFSSAHVSYYKEIYEGFLRGYSEVCGEYETQKILKNVSEIERRGRYTQFI